MPMATITQCDNPACKVQVRFGVPVDWYEVAQEKGPYKWQFCSAACLVAGLGPPVPPVPPFIPSLVRVIVPQPRRGLRVVCICGREVVLPRGWMDIACACGRLGIERQPSKVDPALP